MHIVWTEPRGTSYEVYYARSGDDGRSWTVPADIADSPLPALGANIALGPDDALHVCRVDRRDGDQRIYYTRSSDGGETWAAPRDISGPSPDGLQVNTASIPVDMRDRVHLAWHVGSAETVGSDAYVLYVQSSDGGATFGAPARLSTGSRRAA